MTITVPVAITAPALPLPDPADRATFSARKLEHMRWSVEDLATGASALGTASYNNALESQTQAAAAAASASSALTNAQLVTIAASSTVWTARTYNAGETVYSPTDARIYRRNATGASATDPASDLSNWTLVSPLLRGTTESRGTASISGGVLTLDMLNGVTGVALNANVTSLLLTNNQASANVCHCHTLELVADGTARTFSWPAGNGTSTLLFRWASGIAPTLTSTNGKRDTFFFKSVSQYLFDAYIVGQNL